MAVNFISGILHEKPGKANESRAIKVISYKEKSNWTLETKYNIGKKKTVE